MRRRGFIALPLVVLAAGQARAAPFPLRKTGLHRRQGKLMICIGVPDIIQPANAQRLTSGFVTRVLIRVALFREGDRKPIAQAYRVTDVVYDLWDEKFRVSRTDSTNVAEVREAFTAAEAIRLATDLWLFPVAELARLQPGATYRLSFSADLNPLSQDVITELRSWLARPPGQGRLAPGDSFFGSFVSIFVNPQIEDSERRIQFVSQSFVEPLS